MKRFFLLLLMASISLLSFAQDANSQYLAADQSLMTIPTAYTMPQGSFSLTSFELAVLQLSYSPLPHVHLSAGSVFPITSDMLKTFTIGAKANYFQHRNLQSALTVSYIPDPKLAMIGNVLSYGNTKASAHLAVFWGQILEEDEGEFIFGLGGITNISSRVSGIVEYYNQSDVITMGDDDDDDDDDDLENLLLFGIRFKGSKISWDLGGIRPLDVNSGSLIALPFVKATLVF